MNERGSSDGAASALLQQIEQLWNGQLPPERVEAILTALKTHLQWSENLSELVGKDDALLKLLAELPEEVPFLQESECQKLIAQIRQFNPRQDDSEDSATIVYSGAELGKPGDDLDVQQIGRYRVREKLGSGGMGTVYKAFHPQLEKVVAIKLLRDTLLANPNAIARFEREMKAVGKLDHPNIVRATDAGSANGSMYLVMEFVDGIDLVDLVERKGPLPIADACELIRQSAVGLYHAHQVGLVHRDIKPNNICLSRTGFAKILDLGLAKATSSETDEADGRLTQTSQICGTFDYMAPEQWESTHDVDHRGDIYSLGCTLFYLLIGYPPFNPPASPKSHMAKMRAHMLEPVPAMRKIRKEIPAEVERTVNRMLAKERGKRFQSMLEVAEALAPFAQDHQLLALVDAKDMPVLSPAAVSGPSSVTYTTRKSKTGLWTSLAVALVLVLGAGWYFASGFGQRNSDIPTGEPAATPSASAPSGTVPTADNAATTSPAADATASTSAETTSPESPQVAAAATPTETNPTTPTAAMPAPDAAPPKPAQPVMITPAITAIPDQAIEEGQQFSYLFRISNQADLPGGLQFSLGTEAPEGTHINRETGLFTWTPSEEQGPGVYPITVSIGSIHPNVSPTMATATLKVTEVNAVPVIEPFEQPEISIKEGETLKLLVKARDADRPPNTLRYTLADDAPSAAKIDEKSGSLTWTPGEADGPQEFKLTVRATDDGKPPRFDYKTLTVKVEEVNQPPQLAKIEDRVIGAGEILHLQAQATDADLPANPLMFSLDAPPSPATASIDAKTGALTWTAQPEDIGKTHQFAVRVSEAGDKPLSASQSFSVRIDRYTINSLGMKLAYIPAGQFKMGDMEAKMAVEALLGFDTGDTGGGNSPGNLFAPKPEQSAAKAFEDERPVRVIEISRPFHLSAYEVTQDVYRQVMQNNPSHFSSTGEGSDAVEGQATDRFPAESITWDDAADFCRRLSALPAEKAAGRRYRLPTEAEWEYACRAGSTSAFHTGRTLSSQQANFNGSSGWEGALDGPNLKRTTTVGSFAPNTFGLFDMHGNVAEWCNDWYSPVTYQKQQLSDPQGPDAEDEQVVKNKRQHVVRGGAWNEITIYCRASRRDHSRLPSSSIGFRVVCEIGPPPESPK